MPVHLRTASKGDRKLYGLIPQKCHWNCAVEEGKCKVKLECSNSLFHYHDETKTRQLDEVNQWEHFCAGMAQMSHALGGERRQPCKNGSSQGAAVLHCSLAIASIHCKEMVTWSVIGEHNFLIPCHSCKFSDIWGLCRSLINIDLYFCCWLCQKPNCILDLLKLLWESSEREYKLEISSSVWVSIHYRPFYTLQKMYRWLKSILVTLLHGNTNEYSILICLQPISFFLWYNIRLFNFRIIKHLQIISLEKVHWIEVYFFLPKTVSFISGY